MGNVAPCQACKKREPVETKADLQELEATAVSDNALTDVAAGRKDVDATASTSCSATSASSPFPGTDVPNGYVVVLDKSSPDGPQLGIDVDAYAEPTTLPITAITGGMVAAWNKAHPEAQVTEGDHIVAVNGMKGDVDAMMEKCKTETVLTIIFTRASGGS
eukprot:TRINITY_DN107_c0_g1_i1.p1 TRINITY_DN107_c0_g1~~TRINITY_DN107_c0_g1_i1.p1  ORF type:complete len:161 (-),score=40.22 TRINITY_DN107_c0_g1_i1:325-807(-)